MNKTLLDVEGLKQYFPIKGGVLRRTIAQVHAVDGVSLAIHPGETLGVVGESGCGKSTLGRTILKLYRPTAGRIKFNGEDITHLSENAMRSLRKNMQMIFQDPYSSLNARHDIGRIIEEPLRIHRIGDKTSRQKTVSQLLDRVGLPDSAKSRFPHEFSGGQRQRIGIARAMTLNPKLVICDEPVSALDVSVQSQVINLLLELQKERQLTYMFISHDLGVVRHVSDHIAVMYLGRVVEYTLAEQIYQSPWHPYTQALISAIPEPDPDHHKQRMILKGDVPSAVRPPSGCRFHPRCPFSEERCRRETPLLRKLKPDEDHLVACHFAEKFG